MNPRLPLALSLVVGVVGSALAAPPVVVSTYECLGLYWQRPAADTVALEFRAAGDDAWRPALAPVYDGRDGEYRGSIVGLKPGTSYELRVRAGTETETVTAATRRDEFPVGETTLLPAGDSTESFSITKSGTAQGYHLVTVPPGARTTLDAVNGVAANLTIEADYVIVRGLELKNAAEHGILIKAGRHDIVIEDCHITGWGRLGGARTFGNVGDRDSAVYAEPGTGNLTIQRNQFDHPRGGSNDWNTGHPSGPQGITIWNSTGGNVIRYNDLWSTEDHGFNDGISGGDNFSRVGNMNRDSDIYGNFIRNCWDDAIECEGANMNVRIWGNYLQYFYNGIATAATSRGPLYVFRNVWAQSRRAHDDVAGGAAIKTGGRDAFTGGTKFIFHNTALQPGGVQNAFSRHPNPATITRNNIFDCRGALATPTPAEPVSDYDYDFFSGSDRGTAKEPHGVGGAVAYLPSHALEFYPAARARAVRYGRVTLPLPGGKTTVVTDPVLTVPNPVIDAGVVLPNFNVDFAGSAPDLGAFELQRPPLQFGRRAYRAPSEGWAPWQLF